jgi:hypothetical protein
VIANPTNGRKNVTLRFGVVADACGVDASATSVEDGLISV